MSTHPECQRCPSLSIFFFNDTATTEIYTLSLHDALPILPNVFPIPLANRFRVFHCPPKLAMSTNWRRALIFGGQRSEEHTSELQSQSNLVCRLLLEKKKKEQKRTLVTSVQRPTASMRMSP